MAAEKWEIIFLALQSTLVAVFRVYYIYYHQTHKKSIPHFGETKPNQMLYRRKLIYFSISIIKSVRANINLDIIVLNFPRLWFVCVCATLTQRISAAAYMLAATLSWSTIDVARTCNIISFFFFACQQKTKQRKNRQSSVVFHFTAFYMRSILGRHVLYCFVFFPLPLLLSCASFLFGLWISYFPGEYNNINLCFLSSQFSIFDPLICSSHFDGCMYVCQAAPNTPLLETLNSHVCFQINFVRIGDSEMKRIVHLHEIGAKKFLTATRELRKIKSFGVFVVSTIKVGIGIFPNN